MEIWKEPFAYTKDGQAASKYFLRNSRGTVAVLTDFGCTLLSLCITDRGGTVRDVILGYDRIEDYEEQVEYLGATVGRYAGTIPYGRLRINGTVHDLTLNIDGHNIHGGCKGFTYRVWEGQLLPDGVRFSLTSPHGDEGYPGDLAVSVTCRLTEEDGLHFIYDAVSDRDTVCSMTCHAYFNLEGHGYGSVLDHVLWTPVTLFRADTPQGLPDARLFDVAGTPFDFTSPHTFGRDLHMPHPQLDPDYGYDRNGYLGQPGQWKTAAVVKAPSSGITMQVRTTQCGMQLYCPGYLLQGHPAKEIGSYQAYGGFCLETQHCLSPEEAERGALYQVLPAGKPYHMETVYQFIKE